MNLHAIHTALVALAPFSAEPVKEPPDARADRLEVYAVAIDAALRYRPRGVPETLWAGALIELGNAESRYALYVHAGKCSTGPRGEAECDSGRSKGAWQQQRAACPRVWELPDGSQAQVREAARCAAGRLTGAYFRCRGRNRDLLAGAFSGYAGIKCDQDWAYARAKRARNVAWRLS